MASKKKPGYIPLSEVVYSALMDVQETEARFEQYLHWAIKGYQELNTEGHLGVRHKELPISAYKTVALPDDCVDWTLIGIKQGTEIRAFTKNNNMHLDFQRENERGDLPPAMLSEIEEKGYYFYGTYNIKGEHPGKHFGLKLKNNSAGYFRENKEERIIELHPNTTQTITRVYLEYISDCTDYAGVIMVHLNMRPVLEAFIHWKDAYFSSNPNKVRLTGLRQEQYKEEYDKFVAKNNDLTVEDIEEILFDAYSLSPNY
jgi:hypothetical protein